MLQLELKWRKINLNDKQARENHLSQQQRMQWGFLFANILSLKFCVPSQVTQRVHFHKHSRHIIMYISYYPPRIFQIYIVGKFHYSRFFFFVVSSSFATALIFHPHTTTSFSLVDIVILWIMIMNILSRHVSDCLIFHISTFFSKAFMCCAIKWEYEISILSQK